MADLYSTLSAHPIGKSVTRSLGLPQPTTLRRGRTLPEGAIALGVVSDGEATDSPPNAAGLGGATLELLGITSIPALLDAPETRTVDDEGRAQPPAYPERIGALVLDATGAKTVADLETVRALLRPALKGLGRSGRVVVLGPDPDQVDAVEAGAAAQALEGITRSVGKELRAGGTANLVHVADGTAPQALASTLSFLLEGRSAYVSGQPLRVAAPGRGPDQVPPVTQRPFEGEIVVVTGAARGIGADIARVFARDGATIVAIDVRAAGQALSGIANEVGGTALQLDITTPDAGERLAAHVASRYGEHARIHAVVHNAGITRDKLLANTDEERWGSVLEVNLAAQLRINEVLLEPERAGGLADGGRIVGVASTSGIAGNRGQTNYAASKAGVIGAVRTLAPRLADRGITVNAVAPGFIETEMTGKIPLATREFARRFNSVQQGGKPVDVGAAIGYLADPASAAVTAQVLRVCGQSQIGA
ncbi:MAG: 3-oxoacyl-ACP reductase [Actinobacteria bacterium]|nr:3-oxoacyl-ACP reductase [Actinomycetota bacterium]